MSRAETTQGLADQQAGGDDGDDDRQQVLQRRQEADGQAGTVLEAEDQFIGLGLGGGRCLVSGHGGGPGKKDRRFYCNAIHLRETETQCGIGER